MSNLSVSARRLCTALTASAWVLVCGVVSPAAAAEPTNLHDHPTIAPLQLVDGHYESSKKNGECIKLATKLLAKRASMKTSSEWRALTGSDAYKSYEESHKGLASGNCSAPAAGAEQTACEALTDKVKQQANALSETTHWKALVASKSWKALLSDFAKAEKSGCVSPTPAMVGTK